jgi:hypothetical protein
MSSRAGIVVGIAAITGGIAMFACGSKSEPNAKSAPEGSTALTATPGSASTTARDPKIDIAPAARPTPTTAPTAATTETNAAFEAQERDGDWAPATEAEIRHRFDTGVRAGRLEKTECRADQCLLTMSGTEEEMAKVIADLESEGGLRNFADHIILGGPEQRDGKLVVKAYAVFDRKGASSPN